jgi:hypothetical protein
MTPKEKALNGRGYEQLPCKYLLINQHMQN